MTAFLKKRPLPEIITVLFLFFLLIVLAFVRDPGVLDSGKVPRLFVLFLGLSVATALSLTPPLCKGLTWSALCSPVVGAYAAYTLVVFVSLAFAGNISAGLIDACRTSSAFLVLGFLTVCFRSTENWREILAKAGTLACILFGAIGAVQVFGESGGRFPNRAAMERVHGLMGNVNLFAGYLLLLLPLSALGVSILSRIWRAAAVLGVLLSGCLLLILQCRSAWLGALLCAGVFTAGIVIRPASFGLPPRTRLVVLAALACGVALLGLGLTFAPADNPLLQRARDTLSKDIRFSDGGRVMVWQATLTMATDRFPLGVGAGNFPLNLHSTRAGEWIDFEHVNREWNQPHNDFLWILAEKGPLGLITFVSLFAFAARSGFRVFTKKNNPSAAWTALAAMAGLAAYLVDSMFSFPLDRVNHQVALALLLAALASSPEPPEELLKGKKNLWRYHVGWFAAWISTAALLLTAGLIILFASWRQERHVALARQAMEKNNWTAMLLHTRRASTPLRTLDSYSVPVSFLQGFALMKSGRTNGAIALFEQARLENPDRHYILDNLANMKLAQRRYEEAEALYRRSIELYPERTESRHNLALSHLIQGSPGEAVELLLSIPNEKRTLRIQATLARALREKNQLQTRESIEPQDSERHDVSP